MNDSPDLLHLLAARRAALGTMALFERLDFSEPPVTGLERLAAALADVLVSEHPDAAAEELCERDPTLLLAAGRTLATAGLRLAQALGRSESDRSLPVDGADVVDLVDAADWSDVLPFEFAQVGMLAATAVSRTRSLALTVDQLAVLESAFALGVGTAVAADSLAQPWAGISSAPST